MLRIELVLQLVVAAHFNHIGYVKNAGTEKKIGAIDKPSCEREVSFVIYVRNGCCVTWLAYIIAVICEEK